MALIVADGTGRADAESYISVADASTYHTNRGNTAWAAASSGDQETALRRAADYMQQAYRLRWKGYRVWLSQALDWPRSGVIYRDSYLSAFYLTTEVPGEVRHAQCELALRALSESLNPDVTQAIKSETVGPLKVEYDSYSPPGPVFISIDQLLLPLLKGTGVNVRLVK